MLRPRRPPPERLAWLLTHEKEIRGLLEAPKAEHFSRYSIRRLRLAPVEPVEILKEREHLTQRRDIIVTVAGGPAEFAVDERAKFCDAAANTGGWCVVDGTEEFVDAGVYGVVCGVGAIWFAKRCAGFMEFVLKRAQA